MYGGGGGEGTGTHYRKLTNRRQRTMSTDAASSCREEDWAAPPDTHRKGHDNSA